jgi:hypothetical protein
MKLKKIRKELTAEMLYNIEEAKQHNKEGHKESEKLCIGIATGLAMALKKLEES